MYNHVHTLLFNVHVDVVVQFSVLRFVQFEDRNKFFNRKLWRSWARASQMRSYRRWSKRCMEDHRKIRVAAVAVTKTMHWALTGWLSYCCHHLNEFHHIRKNCAVWEIIIYTYSILPLVCSWVMICYARPTENINVWCLCIHKMLTKYRLYTGVVGTTGMARCLFFAMCANTSLSQHHYNSYRYKYKIRKEL